jgi:ribosome biogenesis protein BRX1
LLCFGVRPFAQIFAVPKTARRAKPFVDHVLNISIADGKIWFRNYQVRPAYPPLPPPSAELILRPSVADSRHPSRRHRGSHFFFNWRQGQGLQAGWSQDVAQRDWTSFRSPAGQDLRGFFQRRNIIREQGWVLLFRPLPFPPLPIPGAELTPSPLAEFVPSSSVAGAYKDARASKYKGRKGQQEERKVRKEEIDGGRIENELETRSVFA